MLRFRLFRTLPATVALSLALLTPHGASLAQGRAEDYARAASLNERMRGLLVGVADTPTWLDADRFWYRVSVAGGHEFVLVTVSERRKSAPFDHARVAAGLNALTGDTATARTLPFTTFTLDGTRAVRVTIDRTGYSCSLETYVCARTGAVSTREGGARDDADAAPFDAAGWDASGEWWPQDHTHEAEVFAARLRLAQPPVDGQAQSDTGSVQSPDGRQELFVRNYNLWVRPVTADSARTNGAARRGAPAADDAVQLTWDGSEGSAYVLGRRNNPAVLWSPDGTKVAALRVTPGYQRLVRYVESSPRDQLQPKWREQFYQKPGDVVTRRDPVLIDVAARRATVVDNAHFPNAYAITELQWWDDSRGFTFEYNQRGHQAYRLIEVDATSGAARALISEDPTTFFSYRSPADALGSGGGTRWRYDIDDGAEILWMSERDGWKHLYLFDGRSARLKRRVTTGEWIVRNVHHVDTLARRVWFIGSGRDAGQDPYFTKYYRIGLDGRDLVSYTPEEGTHTVTWSTDTAYYVDQWQRPDLPMVTVLKRTSDQSVVMELERGDASALADAGFHPAEPFVTKGRDGRTDIWGIIVRPTHFDPTRTYPVIEQIYAGPHGSFVPKTFQVTSATRTLAEHGFIVVQIDGMGTANRSKAFHDVAWRNLGDAGFPDRILWHRAVAAKYPWYDASRVGIYGTSAGGQSAMGALLFHPGFYSAAFSAVGCHDNRMDKIWWNEQWMGWPIGEHYERASNSVNAHRLQGQLMLLVGELDTNVDPASTMQVVDALVRAQKDFELVVLPGQGHTSGGAYGVRRMTDFFVRSLADGRPPARNAS